MAGNLQDRNRTPSGDGGPDWGRGAAYREAGHDGPLPPALRLIRRHGSMEDALKAEAGAASALLDQLARRTMAAIAARRSQIGHYQIGRSGTSSPEPDPVIDRLASDLRDYRRAALRLIEIAL